MIKGLDGPMSETEKDFLKTELRKMEDVQLFKEVDAQTQTIGWDPTMFLLDDEDEYSDCANDPKDSSDSDENLGSLGRVLLQKPSKLIPSADTYIGRTSNSYIQCMKLRQLKAIKGDNYTLTVNNSYVAGFPEELCREFQFLLFSVADGLIPVENIKLFFDTDTGPRLSTNYRHEYENMVHMLNLPEKSTESKPIKAPPIVRKVEEKTTAPITKTTPKITQHPFLTKLIEGVTIKHLYLPRKNIKLSLKSLNLNSDLVTIIYPENSNYPPTFSEFLVTLCKKSDKWTYLKNTYNLLDIK